MHTEKNIRSVSEICKRNRIDLPEEPGVYAFWWIADRAELMNSQRHIVLKGPGGSPVDVEFRDWWPEKLVYPCLYVGKSTNIKKRFSLNIKRGSPHRLHVIPTTHEKQKPVTTTCQLRYGIEHIFRDAQNPLKIIENKVGFSYSIEFGQNQIAERFFEEDKLIGLWKPWFNVDSER